MAKQQIPYRTILACIWLTIGSALLVFLVYSLHHVLFFLVMAAFGALVLNPAVRRAQSWGMSRGISIMLVAMVAVAVATAIGTGLAAPLAKQGVDFATRAPTYFKQAQEGHGQLGKIASRLHLQDDLQQVGPALSRQLSKIPNAVLGALRTVASAAFGTTIVVILAIFMLVEGPGMIDGFLQVIPQNNRESFVRFGRATSSLVSGYTFGVVLLAAINGVVTAIALAATGVPFVLPLAIWAGLIDVLPVVGGLLAMIPAVLFALGHSTSAALVVLISMVGYQQIKNHVLYPIVIGRAVRLNSLLVLVALLIGTELYGVVGAILAIPIAGILQAALAEVLRITRGEMDPPLVMDSEGALEGGSDSISTTPSEHPRKLGDHFKLDSLKLRTKSKRKATKE